MAGNSSFFYNLARWRERIGLKANIEMLYLADEFFAQRGQQVTIRVGNPIAYTELDNSRTERQWAAEIKKQVYELSMDSE